MLGYVPDCPAPTIASTNQNGDRGAGFHLPRQYDFDRFRALTDSGKSDHLRNVDELLAAG
jgi:hypothetical protein